MKIIKPSTTPTVYRIDCGCGALIQCEHGELVFESDRDGGAYTMRCPCCGNKKWLTSAALKDRRYTP